MHTSLLALTMAVAALAARPGSARACDCDQAEPDLTTARAKLATVVHGRVVAARDQGRRHEIDLFVAAAWNGAIAGTIITLPVDASSCGYFFVPGDEAIIYAPAVGPLEQCAGDRTARVVTGAAMAAELSALGPPKTSAALPPRQAGPTADVIFEGKVTGPTFYRGGFGVRSTKAGRGASKRTEYRLVPGDGAGCAVAIPPRDTVVEVRAARVRGQLVVASCFDDLGVRDIARPRPRARRP